MRLPACAPWKTRWASPVPPTAELIRNIMMTTQYVQDHVIHFYHLHALDWVDIVNALKADPKKAAELAQSFSKWDKNTPAYFTEVQDKIKAFAASGLGIFANGYWGHPAYKLPPEVNLIAWRTTSTRWNGRRRSSRSTPSSAARIRIRITWWAAFPAPST
jgi:Ni,Fe-hydrogenase I large subunit